MQIKSSSKRYKRNRKLVDGSQGNNKSYANFGGVNKFIKDYGGDYFDEEYVNWFMKVQDENGEKLDGFIEKWNLCFPS